MNGGSEIFLQLLIAGTFGGVCAAIANSKGRSGIGWFFGGFFGGCLGLIIICCLSNLNEEQAKWSAQDVQNRRLQEQLRQEQMKNETLRQHTLERLDQHDSALGIDTRQTGPVIGTRAGQPVTLLTGRLPARMPKSEAIWYLTMNGSQEGPLSAEAVEAKIRAGEIESEAMVWRGGMQNWEKLATSSEFNDISRL